MSFAGHAFDMINRIRYNSELIKSRRTKYKQMREEFTKSVTHKIGDNLSGETISYKDIERIKDEIRNRLRAERKKALILAAITTAALFLLAILIFLIVT